VTIDDLPDYVVAGQPIRLSFVVRQHGMRLLDGLEPVVDAKLGSATISVKAKQTHDALTTVPLPGPESGRYAATLTLPRAGEWTLSIQSGFGVQSTNTVALHAMEAGASPRALSDVERGRRLFIAKGCFTCHVNTEVTTAPSIGVGPELTGRRYPAVYLAKFLANPDSIRLTQLPRTSWVKMPNLGLKEREIASFVAMINSGGREVSVR
jgi:mono/diheme cytochrome c family protein